MAELPDTPEAKYTRQDGMQKGEAQEQNEGVQLAKDLAAQNPAQPFEELPVEFSPRPEDGDVPVPFGDEDKAALFGPTDRPEESFAKGSIPLGRYAPPANVGTWLPLLQEAATDPDSPPQLRKMLQLIVHHMDGDK